MNCHQNPSKSHQKHSNPTKKLKNKQILRIKSPKQNLAISKNTAVCSFPICEIHPFIRNSHQKSPIKIVPLIIEVLPPKRSVFQENRQAIQISQAIIIFRFLRCFHLLTNRFHLNRNSICMHMEQGKRIFKRKYNKIDKKQSNSSQTHKLTL